MSSSFARLSHPGLGVNNYSFYAVPVAAVLALGTHMYGVAIFNKERAPGTEEWDNCQPKKNLTRVDDVKLSPAMADRFARAEAANDNSFVGLPLFASAIIAGNMAGLSAKTLNTAAGLYLGFRTAYSFFYINGTTKLLANLRSASWLGAICTSLTLFVQAGNRFRSGLGKLTV